MNTLILYGSQYGTTKRYAEKFAEMTGLPVAGYEDIKNLTGYDRVIYFGGLYAGGVKGLKNTVKKLAPDAKLVIVTVGLADVRDEKNIANIRNSLKKQVPEHFLKTSPVFHLRGGIDYRKLTFPHKVMMTLLYNKVKSLPEDKRTAEDRALIETFQTKADFVDYALLKHIAETIS